MAWKRIVLFLFIFSINSEATEIGLKKVAEFNDPWGSTFISNEELLLTEKSGKITELAVREIVHGRPIRNVEALANPEALSYFKDCPELLS